MASVLFPFFMHLKMTTSAIRLLGYERVYLPLYQGADRCPLSYSMGRLQFEMNSKCQRAMQYFKDVGPNTFTMALHPYYTSRPSYTHL